MFKYYLNLTVPILSGFTLQYISDMLIKAPNENSIGKKFDNVILSALCLFVFGIIYSFDIKQINKHFLLTGLFFILLIIVLYCFKSDIQKKINFSTVFLFLACGLFLFEISNKPLQNLTKTSELDEYYSSARDVAELFLPKEESDPFRIYIPYDDFSPMGFGHAAVYGFNYAFGYSNPVTIDSLENYWYLPMDVYCDLLNIRYIAYNTPEIKGLYKIPEDISDFNFVNSFDNIINRNKVPGIAYVYEKVNRPGHAWFIDKYDIFEDRNDGFSKLKNPDFKLGQTALVQKDFLMPNLSAVPLISNTEIVSYKTNSIAINTYSNKEALLIVSEYYYSGWKVKIDGKPAKLQNVNVCLRGVIVPEGTHLVKMYYLPNTLVIGLLLSLISILAISYLCIIVFKKYKIMKQES
jgi:uncharacterized membrane protein YfhO